LYCTDVLIFVTGAL